MLKLKGQRTFKLQEKFMLPRVEDPLMCPVTSLALLLHGFGPLGE